MRVISSIEDAKALEGVEVGLSDWVVIDQNRIDQFAEATGDYQWIHVDTERAAAEMPDGKTIAHGYLTLSLIPTLTGNFVEVKNLARAINFGVNKVRFYTPVRVGAPRAGTRDRAAGQAPGRCAVADLGDAHRSGKRAQTRLRRRNPRHVFLRRVEPQRECSQPGR